MTLQEKAREWAEKNVRYDNGKSAIQQLEEAYLAGASGAMEWIPVSERLPESGENVLILHREYGVGIGYCTVFKSFAGTFHGVPVIDEDNKTTHWMPVPPEKETSDKPSN